MIRKHFGLLSAGQLPILAIFFVAMAFAPAKAQTVREWIDPTGGNYDDILNWTGFNVPDTISESARFNIVGTYDVVQSPFLLTTVSDLLVNNGDVTFIPSNLFQATFTTDDDALISGGDLTLAKLITSSVTLNVGDLLTVRGGSTLSVIEGSDVTAAFLSIGTAAGDGTLLVDGAGSSVTTGVGTLSQLGAFGNTADITFRNGAMGDLDGLDLSASGTAGTTSIFRVESGATVTTGNLNIVPLSDFTTSGTITVDGVGSSLTQNGGSSLAVGNSSDGTATINVQNGGTFTTGTGLTRVDTTGTVNVNTGGTFNLLGDLSMGGLINVQNGGIFNTGTGSTTVSPFGGTGTINIGIVGSGTFNANGNLTIDRVPITRGADSNGFNLGSGLTLTAQNLALIDFVGAYSINQGTTFDIQSGADFRLATSLDIGDAGGNGTLIVDGAGSSATVGAASSWGSSGNTADVTFRVAATGNLGGISLANDSTSGTTGNINVESGAVVIAGNLDIAASGGATTSGTITVDGAGSSLAQEGAFDLVVGHATSGTATINVQNGGTFSTGTGVLTVNATGAINIGVVGSGTFVANGNITVDGGTITRGSDFDDVFNLTPGLTLVAQNNAQVFFGGHSKIDQGITFDIQSGADFTTTDSLSIGGFNGDGTLVVDGAGSSLTTTGSNSSWGFNGNTADVTFRNGATGNLGVTNIAIPNSGAGTTGIFRVESGATVTTDSLNIVADGGITIGGTTISGTITVDGLGSSLTLNGGSDLTVGHATSGPATINVQNSGTFTTGTGLTKIDTTGTVNVNSGGTFNLLGNLDLPGTFNLVGGTLTAVDPVITSGSINFVFGTVELNGNQALDSQLSAELDIVSLDSGKTLHVNGVATLLTPLTLAGGTFATESLVNPFLLDFQSGTFELTSDDLVIGQTGLFGPSYVLETSRTFNVTNTTTIDVGSILEIKDGGSFSAGTLNVNGEFKLSGLNAIGGGSIVNNAGLIRGIGRVNGLVSNSGLIQAFDQTDELIFNNPVTNETGGLIAIRDSAVRFGQGLSNSGQLSFGPGTSDLIGDLTNDGTMGLSADTIVSVVGDIVQNSTLNLLSGSRLIIFDDYSGPQGTTGPGTLEILGLLSPGASPAELDFGGDLVLGTGTLIELGGTTKGSQYDALNIAGLATLGGILDVQLINGFTLGIAQEFGILDAGTLSGTFAGLAEGALVGNFGGTDLFITYAAGDGNEVSLFTAGLLGDYNGNGIVDAADYTVWLDNLGGTTLLNDPTPGTVDQSDYAFWKANFGTVSPGNGAASGSGGTNDASVPEPSSLLLAFFALAGIWARWR